MTDWIEEAMSKLSETLNVKGHDYSPEDDQFGGFDASAHWHNTTRWEIAMGEVAKKMDRLSNLRTKAVAPLNESLVDSVKDIAGYAVLALAMLMSEEARQKAPDIVPDDSRNPNGSQKVVHMATEGIAEAPPMPKVFSSCGSGPHFWGEQGKFFCEKIPGHEGDHYADNNTMSGVYWR